MQHTEYNLLTPASGELIPLQNLKAALRIQHDDEDELLAQILATAATFLERRLGLALGLQSWRAEVPLSLLAPAGHVTLRPTPLIRIDRVQAANAAGETEALDSAAYAIAPGRSATVAVDVSSSALISVDRVLIDFTSGHEDLSTVPDDLIRALYLLSAHYYEERELFRQQRYIPVPLSMDALLAARREVQL